MKKLLCAVLAVILLLSCGAFALTKNEIYKAAVDSFTEYLNDNDSVSLDTLYTNFASLGTYEWSMQFMLYTDILRSVQNGSYARVSTYLTVLRSNQDFCAFLEEQSKKSKVGSVDELEAYVRENPVDIAVICTPRAFARSVCDRLADLGIRGVWNFAPVELEGPAWMTIENVNMSDSLLVLSYRMGDGMIE